jgi:hypothetical protein
MLSDLVDELEVADARLGVPLVVLEEATLRIQGEEEVVRLEEAAIVSEISEAG